MTFFIIAVQDGDSYPKAERLFTTEEAALDYARTYDYQTAPSVYKKVDGIPGKLTYQYDLDDPMYMHDPLQLGRAEEGGEIVYYRGLTNEHFISVNELNEKEKKSIRPL
jgi:hypothetical protein